jgi:mannose-6-phosphate isomerase-like protein (cupin superfamily)
VDVEAPRFRPAPWTAIAKEARMARDERASVVLAPGEGRRYDMGRIQAVFKADGSETVGGYSISEWWLESHTSGPGPHSHPEDDTFYVLEGTMSVFVGDHWIDAAQGSFVLVPGGTIHDFENRSSARAGMLNLSSPGNFEEHMPGIVDWFHEHPPGRPAEGASS